jgi:hypothetical protein
MTVSIGGSIEAVCGVGSVCIEGQIIAVARISTLYFSLFSLSECHSEEDFGLRRKKGANKQL